MKAGNEKSRKFSGLISHSRFPYRGFLNAGLSLRLRKLSLSFKLVTPNSLSESFVKGSQVRITFFKRRISFFCLQKKVAKSKAKREYSNLGGKGHKRGMKLLIGYKPKEKSPLNLCRAPP